MEGIAIVLTDACLADCIEKLRTAADYPSTDDLNEVPGIIERLWHPCNSHHARSDDRWRGSCRSNHREILKSDETLGLPTVETSSLFQLSS